MIHRENILIEHLITEKATEQASTINTYTFKVSSEANRVSIRHAVESQFGVDVESVRVSNTKAKYKQNRTRRGQVKRRSAYKKALVKLKEGSTIDMA
jgi:large subunit ribosomal protein L23